MMGLATPLGYIIVGKVQDPKYQQLPEDKWSKYRLENKYKLKRTDFDSMLEESYEIKKDTWIEKEKDRDFGYHHEERFKLGVWLGQQKLFQEQKTKAQKNVLARNIFKDLTTAEVEELVEIANMGIQVSDIAKLKKQQVKDAQKETS